jgi:hypothetical protein
MEEQTNEIPESVSLVNAVNEATRGPRFGIFEQVLCTHIYLAANTPEALKKIQHVTDAALMIDSEKVKTLKIDIEKISVIKAVCTALSHAIKTNIPNKLKSLVSIRFGFVPNEENYKKYIEPWSTDGLSYYPEMMPHRLGKIYQVYLCAACRNEIANGLEGQTHIKGDYNFKVCDFCGANLDKYGYSPYIICYRILKDKKVSDAEFQFGVFSALSEDGYVTAINCFLQWSETFILETMRKLTEAIKPEIYNEVVKLYQAQRQEQKNVS